MMYSYRLFSKYDRSKGTFLQCLNTCHTSTFCTKPSSPILLTLQKSCAKKKISKVNEGKIAGLFTAHGLTSAQIRCILSLRPNLLLTDIENILKSNLNLFASLKLSGPELANLATKVTRQLELRTNNVVELLKEYEFTEEEILSLAKKQSSLYLLKQVKNLRPKLEYFKSTGFTNSQVRRLLTSQPNVLRCSLEQRIIPAISLLMEHLGEDTYSMKVRNLYQSIRTSTETLKKIIERKTEILQSHGIPSPLIKRMFLDELAPLFCREERLLKVLEDLHKLGIKPTNPKIVVGIRVMLSLSKQTRERKMNVFRSFGLSEEEISAMVRLQPACIKGSSEKLRETLEFFIDKLKMSPVFIRKYPFAVQLSMKNRILPRCAVIEILAKKELIKSLNLGTMMAISEEKFVERIIDKHKTEVPEIVMAYKGEISFTGFPAWFKLLLRKNI